MEKMINMPLARLEETIVWVAKIVYNTIIKISVIMLIFGAAIICTNGGAMSAKS